MTCDPLDLETRGTFTNYAQKSPRTLVAGSVKCNVILYHSDLHVQKIISQDDKIGPADKYGGCG